MAISSIKNDGFPSGYRWVLSLSHGSAMGATSEAKQDNLREVESQVAALKAAQRHAALGHFLVLSMMFRRCPTPDW